MTVSKVDTGHAVRQLEAALVLLKAAHGQEVVQGTVRDAAIAQPLRTLERVSSLCAQVATEITDQMIQLRDGWPSS